MAARPTLPSAPETRTVLRRLDSAGNRNQLVSSDRDERQRSRLNQVKVVRYLCQKICLDDTKLRVRMERQSEDLVADGKFVNSGSELEDGAGDIPANNSRKLDWEKILRRTGALQKVDWIDAGRCDSYQNFARTGSWVGIVRKFQHFRTAVFIHHNCFPLLSPSILFTKERRALSSRMHRKSSGSINTNGDRRRHGCIRQ